MFFANRFGDGRSSKGNIPDPFGPDLGQRISYTNVYLGPETVFNRSYGQRKLIIYCIYRQKLQIPDRDYGQKQVLNPKGPPGGGTLDPGGYLDLGCHLGGHLHSSPQHSAGNLFERMVLEINGPGETNKSNTDFSYVTGLCSTRYF